MYSQCITKSTNSILTIVGCLNFTYVMGVLESLLTPVEKIYITTSFLAHDVYSPMYFIKRTLL